MNRQHFVSAIVGAAERVRAEPAAGTVHADPGDDLVIAAAFGGRAGFVVSLDRDLLGLREVRGVRVLTPGDFLRELR